MRHLHQRCLEQLLQLSQQMEKIAAPCDGEVMNIFDTGHAVCIATEAGAELLIHIGRYSFHGWKRICKESKADGAKGS